MAYVGFSDLRLACSGSVLSLISHYSALWSPCLSGEKVFDAFITEARRTSRGSPGKISIGKLHLTPQYPRSIRNFVVCYQKSDLPSVHPVVEKRNAKEIEGPSGAPLASRVWKVPARDFLAWTYFRGKQPTPLHINDQLAAGCPNSRRDSGILDPCRPDRSIQCFGTRFPACLRPTPAI